MKHITDEQLDALKRELQYRVNERGAFPKDLSRQLLTAIQTFRSEREAHQATRAELEQLRARLELIPAMAKEHESKGANDPFALATGIALRHVYAALKGIEISDAARAGQEEGVE